MKAKFIIILILNDLLFKICSKQQRFCQISWKKLNADPIKFIFHDKIGYISLSVKIKTNLRA